MSYDELRHLMSTVGTCASPRWVCATADKYLRAADAERTRMKYYSRKKKREGHSEAEIKQKEKRKGTLRKAQEVDLNAIL